MIRKAKLIIAASLMIGMVPVSAQPVGTAGWNSETFWRGAPENVRDRVDFLQQRIDRGLADGSLNRREGTRAQNELRRIRMWARHLRMRDGRLSDGDRAQLQARLDDLSRRIRWMRHNDW